jgi:hypothetical protein
LPNCKPVSEVVLDNQVASAMGDTFEGIIRADYCKSKGGCQFFPLLGEQDFADNRKGLPTVTVFLAFLKANNDSLDLHSIGQPSAVPDLMTDSAGRREFYEIKPNSQSGIAAGRLKIGTVTDFLASNNLIYLPGTLYKPDVTKIIYKESAGFIQYEVSVHWFALEDGLIVYEICTVARFKVPSLNPKVVDAIEKALALAIVALLIVLSPEIPRVPVPVPPVT